LVHQVRHWQRSTKKLQRLDTFSPETSKYISKTIIPRHIELMYTSVREVPYFTAEQQRRQAVGLHQMQCCDLIWVLRHNSHYIVELTIKSDKGLGDITLTWFTFKVNTKIFDFVNHWNSGAVQINVTKLVIDNTIHLPWRNFVSPEFGTKFQTEVPLFFWDTRISP